MPSPHDNNWQGELSPTESQGQPTQQDSSFEKMIKAQIFIAIPVAIVGAIAWEKLISPVVEIFIPPYQQMSTEVSPEAADLIQASIKNCRSNANEYSRRACKSVWANVTIPNLEQTATANVNVPR